MKTRMRGEKGRRRQGRGVRADGRRAGDGRMKKKLQRVGGNVQRESSDSVIALQRSPDKQHFRASAVK